MSEYTHWAKYHPGPQLVKYRDQHAWMRANRGAVTDVHRAKAKAQWNKVVEESFNWFLDRYGYITQDDVDEIARVIGSEAKFVQYVLNSHDRAGTLVYDHAPDARTELHGARGRLWYRWWTRPHQNTAGIKNLEGSVGEVHGHDRGQKASNHTQVGWF